MAILHFDGFDTYAVLPGGETQVGVNASAPLLASGWTGDGITTTAGTRHQIIRPAAATVEEPRHWMSSSAGDTSTTTTSTFITGTTGRYRTSSPNDVKAVIGFKVASVGNIGGNLGYSFVCRFALGKRFIELNVSELEVGRIGLVTAFFQGLEVAISPTQQANINGGAVLPSPTNNPATLFNSTFTHASSNTIELEIDPVNDTATCWINNIFVGSLPCLEHPTYDEGAGPVLIMARSGRRSSGTAAIAPRPYAITDLYMLNGVGPTNVARLGKVKVLTRLPTDDVQAEFDRPGGAASNSEVASQVPPSSSNYLTGINIGDTDLYSSTNFDFSNEAIIATGITVSGFKTDPAGNNIAPVLSVAGTVYELNEVQLPVGQTYGTHTVVAETNPATGLPFTKTALDATNFGVRVTSAE